MYRSRLAYRFRARRASRRRRQGFRVRDGAPAILAMEPETGTRLGTIALVALVLVLGGLGIGGVTRWWVG